MVRGDKNLVATSQPQSTLTLWSAPQWSTLEVDEHTDTTSFSSSVGIWAARARHGEMGVESMLESLGTAEVGRDNTY